MIYRGLLLVGINILFIISLFGFFLFDNCRVYFPHGHIIFQRCSINLIVCISRLHKFCSIINFWLKVNFSTNTLAIWQYVNVEVNCADIDSLWWTQRIAQTVLMRIINTVFYLYKKKWLWFPVKYRHMLYIISEFPYVACEPC